MKNRRYRGRFALLYVCALLACPAAQAQTAAPPNSSGNPADATVQQGQSGMSEHLNRNHGDMPGMSSPSGEAADGAAPRPGTEGPQHGIDMGAMQGMPMGPMQGGKPPPGARDPNAYAEGARRSGLGGMEMLDNALIGRVLFNSLELANGDDEHGQNVDVEAWYGSDYNKAWIKAEGDRRNGRLETLRTEVLWSRAFAPFWDTQLGVRHDTGSGAARDWLAFGVQGLAPYWFETEATGYWRAGGGVAARVDVRYELLFTQRLILEPEFEANFYSKTDQERATGSGLSDLELGLRLRYEIRRQFAPYVGVTWNRKFGGTARFAETSGGQRQSVAAVAGVRVWY